MAMSGNRTQAQRIEAYLLSRGWQIDRQTRTTRYKVFIHRDEANKLYLGKAGALRIGPNVGDSIPAPRRRAAILKAVPV